MNIDDWQKTEYEELHRYGRSVYESFFRLARMSFALNSALGAGLWYLIYPKPLFSEYSFASSFISFLGFVYNIGAGINFFNSNYFLSKLAIRSSEIEKIFGGTLHNTLLRLCPLCFIQDTDFAKLDMPLPSCSQRARSYMGVFGLTILFFSIATAFWLIVFLAALPRR